MIVASAPTRLDFGGGWTDVPPFPEERGGFVCNIAIERRATVTLTPSSEVEPATVAATDPLIEAARRRALRACSTSDAQQALRALDVSLHSDFPVGAGLGGSSAVGVALAAAFATHAKHSCAPERLSELSRATEVDELGMAGGFQDHYAAAFGGALGLTLAQARHAAPLPLTRATIACLEHRLTLVYTGESRISAETITAVLDAYAARDAKVVAALDRMAELARLMADALSSGDVSGLAELVSEHWIHQQSLHPRITTDRIQAIERAARHEGATGFKALGASGGGCVMILSSVNDAPAVRAAASSLGEILPWRVATQGVRVQMTPAR
ncbi:MAG: hypothetical protein IBJ03_07380 [Gemmatimonadaceae bacterium]|nr:hypothetical protein [Gemmatimonadaceae bacterium]